MIVSYTFNFSTKMWGENTKHQDPSMDNGVWHLFKLQLGQPSVNPPRLLLEVGGTSTLQAAMPVKLKSPPLQASKWGGGLQLSRHGCLLS